MRVQVKGEEDTKLESLMKIIFLGVVGYFVIIRPTYKTIYYFREYDSLLVSIGPMVLQVISLIVTVYMGFYSSQVMFICAVVVTVLVFIGSVIWNAVHVTKEGANKQEFYEAIWAQLFLPFSMLLIVFVIIVIIYDGVEQRHRRRR